ncbi:hypothetical protein P154DRAFT_529322 [Amniculicola lignicola CBS 123094]|uniref:Uncharacterized protein n=1 Tax=Amniculicola lignicola CBS 123094 TaxID=1392246 RepID=A0A6A5X0L8_9PLEO|nr:hypothetical protein P154DRAFT_529322 [Amniculicola lignicola CBS 123094]
MPPTLVYEPHPLLPAHRPRDYPHIITMDSLKTLGTKSIAEFRPCDSTATLLHNIKDQFPNALQDFFNPEVSSFKLLQENTNPKCGTLVIWRRKQRVWAGIYNFIPRHGIFAWSIFVNCSIAADGKWTTEGAAARAISTYPLESIWNKGFVDCNDIELADPSAAFSEMDAIAAEVFLNPFFDRRLDFVKKWEDPKICRYRIEVNSPYTVVEGLRGLRLGSGVADSLKMLGGDGMAELPIQAPALD